MEWYPGIARAQARVNILNTSDRGWYVAEVEGGFAVRHDGSAPPAAPARMAITITRRRCNSQRVDFHLQAA
jgi:hypothetical protein